MRLLVVVTDQSELQPMKRLLAKAGMQAEVWLVNGEGFESKPSMKELRELKVWLDRYLATHSFDTIIAAGETAARLVLDKSTASITKLRGRDFDYAYGVKEAKKTKRTKGDNNSGSEV